MGEVMVGAQLYTLRDSMRDVTGIARTLARLAEIGYRSVQVSGIGKIEPKELRKILDNEGISAVSSHTPYQRLIAETEAVAAEHQVLGARHVACPMVPETLRNERGYHELARELSRAGEVFAKAGITLAYHNHAVELEKYGNRTGLEIIFSESDPRYLEAEIDTYWIAYGGGDPAAWCEKCRGRLTAVHLKDMGIRDNAQLMTEVGEGNLNWPAIISACRKAGTSFYLVEQDICRRDPLESLAISLANLKALGLD